MRHVRADAGIQSHGADVHRQVIVAGNQVEAHFFRLQQPGKVGKGGGFTENLHKIVAAAPTPGRHRRVGEACRPGDHLAQRSVAAAGINAQVFPGLGCLPGKAAALAGSLRHGDFIVETVTQPPDFRGILRRSVPASRRRVDDEQVFHGLPSVFFMLSYCRDQPGHKARLRAESKAD